MMAAPRSSESMTLDQLLQGYALVNLPELPVAGLCSDSQSACQGDLFIAMRGFTRHALEFIADAVDSGIVAVCYDAEDEYCLQRIALLSKQYDLQWVAVANLQKVCGEIASRFYGHPSRDMQLVGVTGTDGKTSVTHLLVQSLTSLGQVAGSVGTLGYGVANQLKMTRFTTPDPVSLQRILFELKQKSCETVVMEVSSHALQQYRAAGCQFDIAVLTNLGSDHLDYHGEHENYAAAKARLFHWSGLKKAVLNLDDEFGQRLKKEVKWASIRGYSRSYSFTENGSAFTARLLAGSTTDKGLRVQAGYGNHEFDIQTLLIGDFNIDNLLACLTVLNEMNFPADDIESAMQGLLPIPGRMEFFPGEKNGPGVVIDFAHTEQALEACLEAVKDSVTGRLFCVFGCGGDRDQGKRARMAAVAEARCDVVFLTDDNPRSEAPESIMKDILSGFEKPERVRVIHDRETAIETALNQASIDDLVVIAGKGHEQFQLIGNQRIPFSDRHVVRRIRGKVE